MGWGNAEKARAYGRMYKKQKYCNDPVYREKFKSKARERYRRNREAKMAQMRAYRLRKKLELEALKLAVRGRSG